MLIPFLQSVAADMTPAGWFAQLWTGSADLIPHDVWLLALLAVVNVFGVLLIVVVPSALGRMPTAVVLKHSRRLADVRLFTSAGSINDAVDLFREPPKPRLPRFAVSASQFGVFQGLRRHVIGVFRAPSSFALSIVLLTVGSALLTLLMSVVGHTPGESFLIVTVPLACIGALLIFLGTGSLTQSWRDVKVSFDSAAIFGESAAVAIFNRTLWPLAVTIGLSGLSAGITVLSTNLSPSAALWTVTITLVILAARFFQSMRGRDIPVEFLAPTVIPGGRDLSAVKILLWMGDGLVFTLTGVLALVLLPWEPMALLGLLMGFVLVGALWGWFRTGERVLVRSPRKYVLNP